MEQSAKQIALIYQPQKRSNSYSEEALHALFKQF